MNDPDMIADLAQHAAHEAHLAMVRVSGALPNDSAKTLAYITAAAVIAGKMEAHIGRNPQLADLANTARNASRMAYSKELAKAFN